MTLVATAIVTACSSTGALPSAQPATLAGRTFISTDMAGTSLVPGSTVTLSFTDDTLGVNGGCNSMSGAYAVTGDRLTTGQMAMTEMACEEPLMTQDQWLAAFLADVTISLDGNTLVLSDGTTTMTLLDKEEATPDQPIEGTLWVVDGIRAGDAVSSVPEGVEATLRIVDGKAEVKFGCNSGGGPVEVTADTLTFGPMISTKMACEAGPAAVESAVTTVLTGTVGYTIDADVLTIDAGANGLMLRAMSR